MSAHEAAQSAPTTWPPPEFDTGVPHSARMYDYWLGGKDNYAVDRTMAEAFLERIPTLREMAHENRSFVTRATAALATAGITQFLDIGTGMPTSPNLHETARAVVPDARVVYVDNDPVVLAHARALMATEAPDTTAYIDGDIGIPGTILGSPDLTRVIDLERPVGLMIIAVLMLVANETDPWARVAELRDALPSGSHLAITHPTQDFDPEAMAGVTAAATSGGMTFVPRGQDDVARLFGDWEVLEPGIVPVKAWRPDTPPADERSAYYWAGVARKP